MDTKSVFKLSFSEEYINEMLNKGWKLVEFKKSYGATFKKCPSNKYICKRVLIDLQFEEDSKEAKSKLDKMSNVDGIEVISLQYENCMMLIYYIIYEKEKIILDEILQHNSHINTSRKYIVKGTLKLLIQMLLPISYTSCYIIIWVIWLMKSESFLYDITLYMCITISGYSCITYVFNRGRGLIVTLYNRYLVVKNSK